MAGPIRGQDAQIKTAKAGQPVALVGETREWSISAAANIIDTGSQGKDWVENLAGQKSFGLNMSGNFDQDDAAQQELIEGELIDFEGLTNGVGSMTYSGQARIATVEIGTPFDGVVSITITARGHGALTRTPGV